MHWKTASTFMFGIREFVFGKILLFFRRHKSKQHRKCLITSSAHSTDRSDLLVSVWDSKCFQLFLFVCHQGVTFKPKPHQPYLIQFTSYLQQKIYYANKFLLFLSDCLYRLPYYCLASVKYITNWYNFEANYSQINAAKMGAVIGSTYSQLARTIVQDQTNVILICSTSTLSLS